MRANLEWFRTFKAIFETGTMSEAAKELHISQPGVGLHLNALEGYVGYPLFERNTRRMVPTARAKLLYQRILDPLTALEEVENSFSRKTEKKKLTLSIGIYPGLFRQVLEPYISALDFNFVVHMESNDKLIDLLKNGQCDLIVTTCQPAIRNITYQVLGESNFIIVAGEGTDTEAFSRIDAGDTKTVEKWLQSQPWYSTSESEHLKRFWQSNFGKDPAFAPNYVVPDKISILRCLKHGAGLALLPQSICNKALQEGHITCLWKGNTEIKNTLYLGQKKNTSLRDEIEQVKDIIIKEFQRCH